MPADWQRWDLIEIQCGGNTILCQRMSGRCLDESINDALVFELDLLFGGMHVHINAGRIDLDEDDV